MYCNSDLANWLHLASSSQHASRILVFARPLRTCETHVNSHHELGDAESKCIANASANVLSARVRDVSKHFPSELLLMSAAKIGTLRDLATSALNLCHG